MTRKFSSLFSEVFRSAISFPLASKFGKYLKRETGHVIETNILKGKLISDQVNNWVTLTSHNHQNFCWFLYPQAMNDRLPGANPDSQPLAYSQNQQSNSVEKWSQTFSSSLRSFPKSVIFTFSVHIASVAFKSIVFVWFF